MTEKYLHSVFVRTEECNGCISCVKQCPTEAIRVRNGKAEIISSRCIDCSECVRGCPIHAIGVKADSLQGLAGYKYNVALAAPSLCAQFSSQISRNAIWAGLRELGFDDVFDVAIACDYVAGEIESYLKESGNERRPLISSSCPAVLRLIQVQFPELIKQVVPVLSAEEAAAIYVRKKLEQELPFKQEEVGIWFITPCPAKGTNIHQAVDVRHTAFTGSIGIASIYAELARLVGQVDSTKVPAPVKGSSYGMGWGACGGECQAIGVQKSLAVSGAKEVYEVLEQISMNKMPDIDYVECDICSGGCVGGPLAAEHQFIGRKNLQLRMANMREHEPQERQAAMEAGRSTCTGFPTSQSYVKVLEPRPMLQLDANIEMAIQKLGQMETILNQLPGINCGACGAPTCQALAEDIVQGYAHETDCIFVLRTRIKKFAQGMIDLSTQIPLFDQGKDKTTNGDKHEDK